jgi:D-alanine-D-alanine ligase
MTSALCFDKSITKSILRAHGIAVPKGFDVELASYQPKAAIEMMAKKLGYPLIIKPASSGASRGVVLVTQPEDLWRAIRTAGKFSDRILIEERLDGQEFSVGVVGDFNNVSALPVVEIRTRRPFFDYRAKYVPGESEELCPAPIGGRLKRNLQRAAIRAFQAVRGQSHSRIDMVFTKRKIFVLEINTFPGLTRGSIFPKELQALGSSLGEFLDRAISLSLSRTTRANRSHIL